MSLKTKSITLILLILFADQLLKLWVKSTMVIGEERHIFGDWFILHFIENNGMAFGMEVGGRSGKVILTLFRMAAATAIGFYISHLIRNGATTGLVLAISSIMAGAIGNVIDSTFYGMIFSESYLQPALIFPEGGGYSSFLHGRVVDMLYFPVIRGYWPDWSPIRAGESFIFFRPIFNLADSAVTVGVFSIILFQKRFFRES